MPSKEVLDAVKNFVMEKVKSGLLYDAYVGFCGDDIHLVMSHEHGVNNSEVHKVAHDAFKLGTKIAKDQGLYGAGQDILVESFSGNIKGMGPGVAEMEFEERPSEPFVVFAADKTEPGAFNFPFYRMFCDPLSHTGLLINPHLAKGVKFSIMDVEENKVAELFTWEEVPEIATALMYPGRYVVQSVHLKSGEPVVSSSTDRLHNIAGTYVGKDDPIAIVRLQKQFPATEEACFMFNKAHFVAGDTRGSHHAPLMPVSINTLSTTYYCNPQVSALGFNVHKGKLVGPVDCFAGANWDYVRKMAARKMADMREQGFIHPATLIPSELEYNKGYEEIMGRVRAKFK